MVGTALRLWRYSAASAAEQVESRDDDDLEAVVALVAFELGSDRVVVSVEILGVDLQIFFNVFLVIVVRGGKGVVIKECFVFLVDVEVVVVVVE